METDDDGWRNSICCRAFSFVEDSLHCRVHAREHKSRGGRRENPLEMSGYACWKCARADLMERTALLTQGDELGGALGGSALPC